MDDQRRWIGYDTFKLVVALILLALLLILWMQRPSVSPPTSTGNVNPVAAGGVAQQPEPSATNVSPTTAPANTAVPTLTPQPTSAPVKPSATPTMPPVPTATAVEPTATPMAAQATATPTAAASADAAAPTPTETPAATTATQTQSAASSGDCPLAAPSRLTVGQQAAVLANLNMRESAGMDKTILKVSLPGSKLDVIGGPVCTAYQNGAYLWWQVKNKDGVTGWSAEASLSKSFYFMEPVKTP